MGNIFTDIKFAGNELWRILAFFGIVLLFLIAGRLVTFIARRFVNKPGIKKNELLQVVITSLTRPIMLVFAAFGTWCVIHWKILILPDMLQGVFETVSSVLNTCAIGFAIYSSVDIADHYFDIIVKRTESKLDDVLVPLIGKTIRILVAILVLLNIATMISGKNIMSIIAGLGVGGIAVALAAQDTIRNFFGSLVILGDKPFEIGDRIEIHGNDGIVEEVGFRSTRIRRLDGHQLTIPNSQIVDSSVRNISSRPYIKRIMKIGVTYNTIPEKVEQAISILKDILHEHEGMHADYPPRVYFNEFKDFSLEIIVMYWYFPPDYWKYMEFSEKINMEILKRFNQAEIEFAFPTQTVYIASDNNVFNG